MTASVRIASSQSHRIQPPPSVDDLLLSDLEDQADTLIWSESTDKRLWRPIVRRLIWLHLVGYLGRRGQYGVPGSDPRTRQVEEVLGRLQNTPARDIVAGWCVAALSGHGGSALARLGLEHLPRPIRLLAAVIRGPRWLALLSLPGVGRLPALRSHPVYLLRVLGTVRPAETDALLWRVRNGGDAFFAVDVARLLARPGAIDQELAAPAAQTIRLRLAGTFQLGQALEALEALAPPYADQQARPRSHTSSDLSVLAARAATSAAEMRRFLRIYVANASNAPIEPAVSGGLRIDHPAASAEILLLADDLEDRDLDSLLKLCLRARIGSASVRRELLAEIESAESERLAFAVALLAHNPGGYSELVRAFDRLSRLWEVSAREFWTPKGHEQVGIDARLEPTWRRAGRVAAYLARDHPGLLADLFQSRLQAWVEPMSAALRLAADGAEFLDFEAAAEDVLRGELGAIERVTTDEAAPTQARIAAKRLLEAASEDAILYRASSGATGSGEQMLRVLGWYALSLQPIVCAFGGIDTNSVGSARIAAAVQCLAPRIISDPLMSYGGPPVANRQRIDRVRRILADSTDAEAIRYLEQSFNNGSGQAILPEDVLRIAQITRPTELRVLPIIDEGRRNPDRYVYRAAAQALMTREGLADDGVRLVEELLLGGQWQETSFDAVSRARPVDPSAVARVARMLGHYGSTRDSVQGLWVAIYCLRVLTTSGGDRGTAAEAFRAAMGQARRMPWDDPRRRVAPYFYLAFTRLVPLTPARVDRMLSIAEGRTLRNEVRGRLVGLSDWQPVAVWLLGELAASDSPSLNRDQARRALAAAAALYKGRPTALMFPDLFGLPGSSDFVAYEAIDRLTGLLRRGPAN